jgi:hypothetical protein
MPAMEAHINEEYVVVIWNKQGYNGRFTDHIVRYTFDEEIYRQERECMQRFVKGRYCTFGHLCVNNVSVLKTCGEVPTYAAKGGKFPDFAVSAR